MFMAVYSFYNNVMANNCLHIPIRSVKWLPWYLALYIQRLSSIEVHLYSEFYTLSYTSVWTYFPKIQICIAIWSISMNNIFCLFFNPITHKGGGGGFHPPRRISKFLLIWINKRILRLFVFLCMSITVIFSCDEQLKKYLPFLQNKAIEL